MGAASFLIGGKSSLFKVNLYCLPRNHPLFPFQMSDLQIQDLQIKQTFLERHIEEQDRVIYAMQAELAKLREEIQNLKERSENNSDGDNMPANEKPPHY